MLICKTYITYTHDLFIVTQEDTGFFVYKIDLDKSNVMEQQEGVEEKEEFKIEKIFDYQVQDTDGRQVELLDIHVRGSSEKEAINVYNKKMMFFLHGDTLYSWTKMPDKYVLNFKKLN